MNKQDNAIRFINATRELMDEQGVENLSVRKIADRAGLHNSTIYLYFDNLNQLIMLASVKYFQEYSHALYLLSQKNLTPHENFLAVWELFMDAALKKPNFFYHFFFGRESRHLRDVLNSYYELFPEERQQFSETIESMYFGENITDRSMKILTPLLEEENGVTTENLSLLNELIISYCKYKLEQKCTDPQADSEQLKADTLKALAYITKI